MKVFGIENLWKACQSDSLLLPIRFSGLSNICCMMRGKIVRNIMIFFGRLFGLRKWKKKLR